VALLELQ
jgi:hypothetical protein